MLNAVSLGHSLHLKSPVVTEEMTIELLEDRINPARKVAATGY